MNSLLFLEINLMLNQHFNNKYVELANNNHLFYKKFIEKNQEIEYISDDSDS